MASSPQATRVPELQAAALPPRFCHKARKRYREAKCSTMSLVPSSDPSILTTTSNNSGDMFCRFNEASARRTESHLEKVGIITLTHTPSSIFNLSYQWVLR